MHSPKLLLNFEYETHCSNFNRNCTFMNNYLDKKLKLINFLYFVKKNEVF